MNTTATKRNKGPWHSGISTVYMIFFKLQTAKPRVWNELVQTKESCFQRWIQWDASSFQLLKTGKVCQEALTQFKELLWNWTCPLWKSNEKYLKLIEHLFPYIWGETKSLWQSFPPCCFGSIAVFFWTVQDLHLVTWGRLASHFHSFPLFVRSQVDTIQRAFRN